MEGHGVSNEDIRSYLLSIRDRILATEDTVCLERARLVTEAYYRYGDEPPPLWRAKTFAHVLRHMTLDLTTNPFFAGNTSTQPRAWMLVPEYGFRSPPQIVHENPQLDGLLDDAIPQDLRDFWADCSFGGNAAIGHLAVDLDCVVHEGLLALIDETRSRADEGTAEARCYRQAMVIALEAVVEWAYRYAAAAEAAAAATDDPLLRRLHERVARTCRHVPAHPARNLFEGLQPLS